MARAGLVAAAALALLAAGCGGGSSGSGGITVGAGAAPIELTGFRPAAPVPPGQADRGRVHDHAARRHAARRLQARPGPAHGRPPDHRPATTSRRSSTATRRSAPTAGSARRSSFPPPARTGSWSTPIPRARRRARPTSSSSTRSRVSGAYHPEPLPPLRAQTVTVDGYRVHAAPARAAARDPARVPHGHRARPERAAGGVHAVVRGARARDLLPQGLARLLPHARLQRRARSAARACSARRR